MTAAYEQLEAACLPLIKHFHDDLVKHDKATITAHPEMPFLHWTRDCGTTLVMMPGIIDDSWPRYGERVKYLFGTADRSHIMRQKVNTAVYHTLPSNSPEKYTVHHFDGRVLRQITVDKAVDVIKDYSRKFEREWDREVMRNENPAEWRRLRDAEATRESVFA